MNSRNEFFPLEVLLDDIVDVDDEDGSVLVFIELWRSWVGEGPDVALD